MSDAQALSQPQTLRVRLFASHPVEPRALLSGPLQVLCPVAATFPRGSYEVAAKNGQVELQGINAENKKSRLTSRNLIVAGVGKSGLPVRYGQSLRHYPGRLSITVGSRSEAGAQTRRGALAAAPHLILINYVARSDYTAGVLASEMPEVAPLQALKAQVVLINSELARYGSEVSLDDTTERESYSGVPIGRPLVRRAVEEVGKQCLLFAGVPIKPYFHSTCAGMTSNAYDVFRLPKQSYPYLHATKCEFCRQSPFFDRHLARIPEQDFAAAFGAKLPEIDQVDAAGRPLLVSYSVQGRKIKTSGYAFWIAVGQKFGWDKAPGNVFAWHEMKPYVSIESRGAGHGVGMCQWGAIGMAQKGRNYEQILEHYFAGTTLSP